MSIEPIGIALTIAYWQQSIGREREAAAKLLILSKPRDISRHDQIVAVVAAKQKYADQCAVVGGGARERAHHSETVQRRGNSERRNRAASDPDEASPREYQRADPGLFSIVTLHRSTWYSADDNATNSASNILVPGSAVASIVVFRASRTSGGICPPNSAMSRAWISAVSFAASSK